MSREFGVINSTTQTIWKITTQLLVSLNGWIKNTVNASSLNEVTSMRRCLSGIRKREMTMYQ